MAASGNRRDSKRRILRSGESVRTDGKYQFKYLVNGKPKFVYSWRLEPSDKLPAGKRPCKSLREMEKELGYEVWLPGNGVGVTCAKSRNERWGYESVFPSQISIDKRRVWL